jgi:hypothetical protein
MSLQPNYDGVLAGEARWAHNPEIVGSNPTIAKWNHRLF